MKSRILLTTPVRPYSTLPGNESLTDSTGQRFTKGNDIFTVIAHTHSYANHILAQNIKTPSIFLEYPHWDDFTAEVKKGYSFIGITAYPVHLDMVIKMCTYIRKESPDQRAAVEKELLNFLDGDKGDLSSKIDPKA